MVTFWCIHFKIVIFVTIWQCLNQTKQRTLYILMMLFKDCIKITHIVCAILFNAVFNCIILKIIQLLKLLPCKNTLMCKVITFIKPHVMFLLYSLL